MSLLPKTSSEFSSKEYWESFFKKSSSFEWYGNYFDLCGILSRYIKKDDSILVPGCGNSELSEQLYDNQFTKISNIDISETVIKQMKKKNINRSDMTFDVMDLKSMSFDDEYFSTILDKGTLDAIMTDDSEFCNKTIDEIFAEYGRVLKIGGRYICITLAQDHILNKLVQYFTENQWVIRVHNIQVGVDNKIDTVMPVFAFVMTKFQKLPQLLLELCLEDAAKPTRVKTVKEVVDSVKSLQYYALIRSKLGKKVKQQNDEHVHVDLYSSDNITTPRYKLFIVDNLHHTKRQYFAIFIVPQGRESDWLFSSKEGRESLGKDANFQRLVVTLLSDHHSYENMQMIQDELSTKVLELAPPNLPDNYKVPFLSDGGGIGDRILRFRGESELTGPYIVEDYILKNDEWFRHLIFLDQHRTVQCEVKLKPNETGKNNQKDESVIPKPDFSFLASEYTEAIATGLSVLFTPRTSFELLVLGLGGGTMCMFVKHNFPNSMIHAVEIDKHVVKIANDWFGVPKLGSTDMFKITVGDAFKFVFDISSNSCGKYNAVVLDIDSKDLTAEVRFPPMSFLDKNYLESVKVILSPNGILLINLLCRNTEIKQSIFKSLCSIFPLVCVLKTATDGNDVLFCFKTKPETKSQHIKKRKSKNKNKSNQRNTQTAKNDMKKENNFNFDILKQMWSSNLKEWKDWRNISRERKIAVDMGNILFNIQILKNDSK